MKTLLADAIAERRLVHLLYEGKSRTVEALLLGKNDRGEDVFLGRQVAPWTPVENSWQVYRLNSVYGLLVLDTRHERSLDPAEVPDQLLSAIHPTV